MKNQTSSSKPLPLSELSFEALAALESLGKYDGPDRIISAQEMEALCSVKNEKLQTFKTGFPRLDLLTGGIQTGELIAIGGPTKNGKSLTAQTMTKNLSDSGVAVLWFSFELPIPQFISVFEGRSVFFLPLKLTHGNLAWLRERIIEAKMKNDCRVVFIDNLHHIIDFERMRNIGLEIGQVIRFVKRLAVELNVCIIILCHSKKPEFTGKNTQEVSEWDLRDSSFIPQESDATIMIQRKIDKETGRTLNEAIIKVCLHRRTGKMGEKVHVRKVGYFLEEDRKYYGEFDLRG